MPIQVTPLSTLTITAAEVARANAAEVAAEATIADLRAQLAAIPPPVVVPPPVTGRTRLYVDGRQLKTKNGTPFVGRGIEFMYNQDALSAGPVHMCALAVALGANSIGPLFAAWYNDDGVKVFDSGSVAQVKALCDAARAQKLVVWVNGDHRKQGGAPASAQDGRAWLNQPAMVALLNGYDHVGLQLEVETDEVYEAADWVAGVKSLIASLRAAGHKSIIKVGAPQGGRRVEFPLARCQDVLAADPERQVIFTAQMYWGEASTSSWYQSQAGVANGLAGTKAALGKLAASPCCFMPGFDWQDDIGTTGELALIDEADRLGLSWQHWALTGDGSLAGNNLIDRFDWAMSIGSITPNGKLLQAKLLARRAFAAL